jgi:hypothetical protein
MSKRIYVPVIEAFLVHCVLNRRSLQQGVMIGNAMNQKGSWETGSDEDFHPPWMGSSFPMWMSFGARWEMLEMAPMLIPSSFWVRPLSVVKYGHFFKKQFQVAHQSESVMFIFLKLISNLPPFYCIFWNPKSSIFMEPSEFQKIQFYD